MLRSHQLTLEITPALEILLERAAALEGLTLEQFVVQTLRHAAEALVPADDVIRLSKDAQEAFAHALFNPPSPNAALKKAFSRHKKLFGH
ncbi:DUF1778 domain-containing protein [Achromobacter spanius]|uniref:type II toxin-antitoxin system TacA family antitoxin n=1 Tax=Achromobacter spanius TaxID=217203 RepID=UPI0036E05EC8